MSGPERPHDDAGAYLLGALEDPEREAFEAHLAGCAECRDELERLRPAAEALPRSVEPLAPPPRLKRELMTTVEREAEPVRAGRRRVARVRLRAPRLRPVVAWGSAAFLLAVGVASGFGLARLTGDETRTIRARTLSAEAARAHGSLAIPGEGKDGAILRVSGMPPLPRGVYQAWVQRDGQMLPQPTFEVGEDGLGAVAVPEDLSGATAVLVTREPRGGSRAPTGRPMLGVRL